MPKFWQGLAESLQRLAVGIGIAAAIGIPVGIVIGYSSIVFELTYIPFQFVRMISPLSWTPVAIILLGIGSGPVYFLVSIAALWPIVMNTAAGVRAADRQWIEVAQCLGAGHLQTIWFVLIRSTLPHILVGLQLALGVAWIVLVPAEMLGVASGLGYMILDARDVNDYASVMALILVIGFLGICLDLPLKMLLRKISF
ncbi:MAG: ABC transporter permease subunit [Candidatus Obscuribacterales bacterium]|nr:ABC transporter permease subunit [Candidatus Obscuribacterales bacterium]